MGIPPYSKKMVAPTNHIGRRPSRYDTRLCTRVGIGSIYLHRYIDEAHRDNRRSDGDSPYRRKVQRLTANTSQADL